LLRALEAKTPPDRRLFEDPYLPRAVLDDPEQAGRVHRFGWQTGFEPAEMARHLADRGLRLTRDWDADQYREQLLRPVQRDLAVFEIERAVVADVG